MRKKVAAKTPVRVVKFEWINLLLGLLLGCGIAGIVLSLNHSQSPAVTVDVKQTVTTSVAPPAAAPGPSEKYLRHVRPRPSMTEERPAPIFQR